MSATASPFIAQYAARKGLRYRPDADERWMRVWEPFATLRTPIRYEHSLEATGEEGSFTIARVVVTAPPIVPRGPEQEAVSWIAIVQDPKVTVKAAGTSDGGSPFLESLDLAAMPRRKTGDAWFDRMFATFAGDEESLAGAVTPSLRKLLLGWQIPIHFELRPGGFILAPVGLRYDIESLAWLVRSLPMFGEKAVKQPPSQR